jgi:beta-lactamase class D
MTIKAKLLESRSGMAYHKSAMPRLLFVSLLCVLARFITCAGSPDVFAEAFKLHGVEGTTVLFDLSSGSYSGYHAERWDSSYIPASTFKILNSLVSLEAGVIADEHTVVRWDSVDRSVAAWNMDHTMASAFKVSAVWFYQELARRVGAERMQQCLDTVGYGNRTMGGPVDEFWLTGGLRITPRQQIDVLLRLYQDRLPFSKPTLSAVRDIMVLERTETYTLRAKTGWSDADAPGVGWFVGYIERAGKTVFFATEIDIRSEKDLPARAGVTRSILRTLGLLD